MNELIAGAATGLLMASLFICAGMLMLFFMVKNPSPGIEPIFQRLSPATIAMGVVAAAYPFWGAIGALSGLLYRISLEQAPGAGIGSPNMVFTLGVVIAAVMMAAPFMILLRQVLAGVLAITLTFIGVFGWFLPYFAA